MAGYIFDAQNVLDFHGINLNGTLLWLQKEKRRVLVRQNCECGVIQDVTVCFFVKVPPVAFKLTCRTGWPECGSWLRG